MPASPDSMRRARRPLVAIVTAAACAVACMFGFGCSRTWLASPTSTSETSRHRGSRGLAFGASAVRWRRPPTSIALRAEADSGVRVGVIHLPSMAGKDFRVAFEKFNVTNETFFQTEVPDSFQFPLAAKLLAMSNTVDVVVAVHGELGEEKGEILRGYQTVALTTNVPIIPCSGDDAGIAAVADTAVQMAEIRQQALMGGGPRKSIFFGIGSNQTDSKTGKKDKIYF
eukprot:TRINITY_DN70212_c0_g1_i1.p1 TRINITY_DN70212_c0_g1~~TRINITY_DN70212_c0_g1_i1.p1  ORF type:complete len:245 (-),score=47.11 TRINITY_DN70212_c0_g1_i1:50-730(-)